MACYSCANYGRCRFPNRYIYLDPHDLDPAHLRCLRYTGILHSALLHGHQFRAHPFYLSIRCHGICKKIAFIIQRNRLYVRIVVA